MSLVITVTGLEGEISNAKGSNYFYRQNQSHSDPPNSEELKSKNYSLAIESLKEPLQMYCVTLINFKVCYYTFLIRKY